MEAYLGSPAMREESREMWNLNKRLEAYLSRVQALEEENELLRAEIQDLKGSQAHRSWRSQFEEEVGALRDALNAGFREKAEAEMERDTLFDEIQQVKGLCQSERQAQEDAKKELAENKKALEEEKRDQMWLKEKALQLELELEALAEIHEADRAELEQEIVTFSQSMENFRVAPVAYQPVDIEDYSQRLSAVWKGAVETYKSEVSSLEANLTESKQKLHQVTDENRQNQAQLQSLEKELSSLKARKAMLEERLSREWHDQQEDVEKFQLDMDSLEQEKQDLRTQISHVLEDRQQLMHLKISLSLEVATYRTLLEAESTRMLMPYTDSKPSSSFRESRLEFSSSPIQALSPDARKYTPKEPRYSSSASQKVESKSSLQRNQHSLPPAKMSTRSKSPLSVTVQTPKVNQVLKSQNLKYTHASAPPKSAPEPKGKSVNLATPISEDVTNIKVETVSKSKLASLTTSGDRSTEELELDVSEHGKKVTDSHVDQKTEEQSDKMPHQEGLKQINREEPPKESTGKDHFVETQSLNENFALQEVAYSNEPLTKTLEDTEEKVEDEEELLEPKIHVANTEASLLKAMGATFDIPSNDTHLDETYGRGLLSLESPSTEVEKQEETEKQIETGEQASIKASKEAFLEPIGHQEEPKRAEPIDIKGTLEEQAEETLVEKEVNEETPVSGIPSAGQAYEIVFKDEIVDIETSQCQNEELKTQSKENKEISDLIIEHVEHLLETGLKAFPEDEWDGHKVSRDEQDIPKDIQGSAEESYRLETFTEVKESRVFQMTEEENMRELASAAEDTEDYDAVSDVQESMFFKTESLSTEDAELTEVMPNETLEHAAADQLMPEGGEREEDMLTDTEDLTEDQEIDDGMEEITEHEIQSVRISEKFGVNEIVTEMENTDLLEDDMEGDMNTIHDNDIWKHETFNVNENILANLNVEVSHLESEIELAKDIASEKDSLSHENLEDNERILSQETVDEKHDEELMSQEGLLVKESELVSMIESESMQPLNNNPSQGPRSSDDFIISAEKMQRDSEWGSKLDSDLADDIPNDESEDTEMENVTEQRVVGQDIQFDQGQVASEVHMGLNESDNVDTEKEMPSTESSYKELSEAEIEAFPETQIVEEHKIEIFKEVERKEFSEEQEHTESWSRATADYQTQSEFVGCGDSVDEQPAFSEEITESEICSVNKQELEHSKEYSLEETLPDTSLLPRYDEETEILALEMQESVELLNQANKETDFIKVDDLSQQEELMQDIEFGNNFVHNEASEYSMGLNEQIEDLNNVTLPPKEISTQEIVEDESIVCPEPNQGEQDIVEDQEAKVQEELVSATHTTEVYQMQSQYSESEDSIDSQNAFLQDISQSESNNIPIQEFENANDSPLDNKFPDTTLMLSKDDETKVVVLEKQLPLEVLTKVNKEEDLILSEETQAEQVLSEKDIPVSLEAKQLQIDSTLSETTTETEKQITEADILFVESSEILEVNKLKDLDPKDYGFTDDFEERRFSEDSQEVVVGREPTETEAPESEMATNAGTISKQDEEIIEKTPDKPLEHPEDLIEETEALKASHVGGTYQEKFEYDETEEEQPATEIPTVSALRLTQDDGHFEDVIDESTDQTEDVIEKIEAFKVTKITHVYQEKFESDITESCEPESELLPNKVTLSREEERDSEDLGEVGEELSNFIEESDALKESELKDRNYENVPCIETEAQGFESEVPSAADTLSIQVEGHFEDVSVESQVQRDEVIEESEDLKASHLRNLDQENVDDGTTESQEFESERSSHTAQLSMQDDACLQDAAAESVEYSEKLIEEKEGDIVTEMIDALQDQFENDEIDVERLISETIIDTDRMSMEDPGVSEDVSVESPEFTESATDEGKDLLASEQSEIYQEKLDEENVELELKSEQNVIIKEFDSVHVLGAALGAGNESVLEQGSAEVVENRNVSSLTTIDTKCEPDHGNQKPEIFHSDSEDSILSDEESPNVTKTADRSEHEVIMSSGSDLTRVSSGAIENIEVLPSTESKDLQYQQDMVAEEYGEKVLVSQQDLLPVSNIDDLCKDIDYPTQSEECLADRFPETADESVESIDVLVGESEMEASEERFVIKHENFLLMPMQFTSESHILEEDGNGLNGFHSTFDVDDPSAFRKEMLNGHSSVDESQEIDLINQDSQEHLESDFKGQSHSELSPKTVFIHETYAEETFAFPKSDESQNLFQKLLGASNQQESSSIEEDQVRSSEEEPTSEDDQNGNTNSSPNPFTQGNDWDDQLQQASKKATFEDEHSLFETDQPSKSTIDKVSGLKSLRNIDDAWSSDED